MNILMMASSVRVGLTFHLAKLSLGLKNKGLKVVVVYSGMEQQRGLKEQLLNADISLYAIPTIDIISLRKLKINASKLAQIIIREDINIIHTQGLGHLINAYFGSRASSRNPPLIMTVHSHFHGSKFSRLYLLLESILLNLLSDLVLAVSEMTRKDLVRSGLYRRKVLVVHNALDLKSFDLSLEGEAPLNAKRILDGDMHWYPIIIWMGSQLIQRKGLIYFLKSIKNVKKRFPNVRCFVTGTGPLLEKMKKTVLSYGLENNVIFTGYIRYESMLNILKRSNVAVITSLAETFCHAIIEPLAARKPIITTLVGVAPEIMKYGVGLTVPKKDPTALANAIIYLLNNPKKAEEMGLRGRRVVEQMFSIEKIGTRLIKAYKLSLISNRLIQDF